MNGNNKSKSKIKSDSNRYGPQTANVRKLLDMRDDDWVILFVCWINWSASAYRDGFNDPELKRKFLAAIGAALDEAERSGRTSMYIELVKECQEMQAQSYLAIVLEDRIGELFTQEHYDLLSTPFANFWAVVNNSEPGSPLRELTVDLMKTFDGIEALREAKRILG